MASKGTISMRQRVAKNLVTENADKDARDGVVGTGRG